MNRRLIAGAACVLLLGAATSAGLAQAQDRGEKGQHNGGGQGGAARQAPRAAAPQRAAPRVERSQPRAERAPQRRTVERPQRERSQQVQRQREHNNVERAERRQREQKQQAERSQREQKQRVENQQREQQQAAERRQREQQRQASPKQNDRPQNKQAGSPERTGPQQVNRIQASDDQRKGVRDRIFRDRHVDRIHAKDFGAKLVVGAHVDRRHYRHLHRLTPAILALAPIYAGYSYLVVDDDICIVDPESYYVVDVIPSSVEYAGGSSRPQLALSADDMSFIYASVPKDRPVDVRVRLALGAEIPARIDLERFPVGVTDRVPQVEGYRYIVVEDDVVIVDPQDRLVALVITG